jgi:hypothetical protein
MVDKLLRASALFKASCGDLVVFLAESLQSSLLLAPLPGRGLGRFLFQRTMHSFMPAILLRMPHSDAFRHDPQFNPSHCQP